MKNPIAWAVSRYKDFMWRREFARLPIKTLGDIHVKEMRGCFYVVDVEEIEPMRIHVGRNKALKVWELYKSNGQVLFYVSSKREAERLASVANNAR